MKRILKIIFRALFIILILFVGVIAFYTIKGYSVYVDALNKVSIEQKVKDIKSKKEYTKFGHYYDYSLSCGTSHSETIRTDAGKPAEGSAV